MDELYMNEAINEATKALNINEVPVGCVVVCNNVIIGRGYNLKETSHNSLLHAEIIAIKQACEAKKDWRLDDCTIYCTMEPCIMCMGAIAESRIRTIVCGIENYKSKSINNLICNDNNISIYRNVCKEKINNMFKLFFNKIRNS